MSIYIQLFVFFTCLFLKVDTNYSSGCIWMLLLICSVLNKVNYSGKKKFKVVRTSENKTLFYCNKVNYFLEGKVKVLRTSENKLFFFCRLVKNLPERLIDLKWIFINQGTCNRYRGYVLFNLTYFQWQRLAYWTVDTSLNWLVIERMGGW